MKVLFVSPIAPWPPDTGGRIRTFKLLKYLAPRCAIHLRAVAQPGLDRAARAELAAHCAGVALFERSPAGALRRWTRARPERWFHSEALRRALVQDLDGGSFDLVHLDEPCLARALPRRCPVPVVVHHHKLDTRLHGRIDGRSTFAAGLEGLRLARLEAEAARSFRHHVLCSPADAAALRARFPELDCTVVPSGFDPDFFAPCLRPPPRRRDALLFLGTLDYGPNVDGLRWFAAEVLPRVLARRPGAVLEVVGRDAREAVRSLATPAIRVLGAPDDVRAPLETASLMVAPLRIGGGTRLKIVEALAMACPVVATRTAAEGLDLADGEHLRLADDPGTFAGAVAELLEDPDEALELARRGRRAALARYTWDALSEQLLDCWSRAAATAALPVRSCA